MSVMLSRRTQMDGGSGDRDRGGGPATLPIIIKLVCPHDRSGSVIGKVSARDVSKIAPSSLPAPATAHIWRWRARRGHASTAPAPSAAAPHSASPPPVLVFQGGDVIKGIRTSTGARIKIEDTVPGMKERAITVSALDR